MLLRVVGGCCAKFDTSGDLGDLVECYSFYLPFEAKFKKNETNNNSQWCLQHQKKPISSVVYSPRHLSSEISSVGLFHNVLTANVLVLQKKPIPTGRFISEGY